MMIEDEEKLTLSHRYDVPNVTFLPSARSDKTLQTSSLLRQVGKTGVRGFSIMMRGGLKGLIIIFYPLSFLMVIMITFITTPSSIFFLMFSNAFSDV